MSHFTQYTPMTEAESFSGEQVAYPYVKNVQGYPEYEFSAYGNGWSNSFGYPTGPSDVGSSNALSLDVTSHGHSSTGLMYADHNQHTFGAMGLDCARAPSGSPSSTTSSLPTPDQLLRLLHEPATTDVLNHGMASLYVTPEQLQTTINPNELHSPSVSPAHSRNVSIASSQSVSSNQRFVSNNADAIYTSHLFAPTQEGLSPQMAYLYSPGSSRRTSYQPNTARSSLSVHSRSPSIITCHSGRDDSGSSVYSPFGHGRTLSASTTAHSPIVVPVTPDIRAGSVCTDVSSSSSPQWSATSSTGGTFGRFPLVASASMASSKKRKRPSVSGSSGSRKTLPLESSEDEYVVAEDADGSDEDFEDDFAARKVKGKARKTKGRSMKKQKLALETTPTHDEPNVHAACTWDHAKSGSCSPSTPQGAEIKVQQLIPIDRDTVSCPHCGFIPGNRRFSDLKRHWEAHLVKDAKDKVRWVCLSCGDVEEVVVHEEQADGSIQSKSVLEYIPKVPVHKKYTRKDSARRHWKQDHGEKGMAWSEGLVVQVDRVRGETIEGQDGHASS